MAKTIGNLAVILGLDSTGFEAGLDRTRAQARRAERDMQQSFQRAGVALLAFAAAGTAAAGLAVKASMDQEIGIRKLDAALKAVGESYAAQRAAIEAVVAAQQAKTNFGDEAQRQALSQLITLSGDYEASLKALPLVLDIAASTGRDLTSIVLTMGRALGGQTTALKTYGIEVAASATQQEIFNAASAKFAGQAEAAADATVQLKNRVGDAAQVFGDRLTPRVNDAARAAESAVRAFNDLPPVLHDVAAAIGVVTGAVAVFSGATLLAVANGENIRKTLRVVASVGTFFGSTILRITPYLAAFSATGSESADVLEYMRKKARNVAIDLSPFSEGLRRASGGARELTEEAKKNLTILQRYPDTLQTVITDVRDLMSAHEQWVDIMRDGVEARLRATQKEIVGTRRTMEDELAVLRQLAAENNLSAEQIKQMVWLEGLLEGATRDTTSALGDQANAFIFTRQATDDMNRSLAESIRLEAARAGATLTGGISGRETEASALEATRQAQIAGLLARGQRGEISSAEVARQIAELNEQTRATRARLGAGGALEAGQVRAAAEGVPLLPESSLRALARAEQLQKQFGGLPKLAHGGEVTSGGMAIVGERGPETVLLPKGAQVVPNEGGAITVNVNVQGLTVEGAAATIARRVQQIMGRLNYEASLRPSGP